MLPGVTGYDRPTFHPNVLAARDATTIAVGSGQDVRGIDVEPPKSSPNSMGFSISGRVIHPLGGSAANLNVFLESGGQADTATDFDRFSTVTNTVGAFSFSNVNPGRYVLRCTIVPNHEYQPGAVSAQALGSVRGLRLPFQNRQPLTDLPTTPTFWSLEEITLNAGNVNGLVLALQPAPNVQGRVAFHGQTAAPSVERLRSTAVVIAPWEASNLGAIPLSGIRPDYTFSSQGLPPGQYALTVQPTLADTGWHLTSVSLAGHEMLGRRLPLSPADSTDLRLGFIDEPTVLAGMISATEPNLLRSARVLLFPSDADGTGFTSWLPMRFGEYRPSSQGAFRIAVDPGDYVAVAIAGDLPEFWASPDVLKLLAPKGKRVRLMPGTTTFVDLRISTLNLPVH